MNFNTVYKSDGISNTERSAIALVNTPFKIHNLTSLELLSCCSSLGQFLNYFDLENNINGTWADSFFEDELTIIADISSFNNNRATADLINALPENNTSIENFIIFFNKLINLIVRIDQWIKHLSLIGNNEASLFVSTINQLIDNRFIENYRVIVSFTKKIAGKSMNVKIPTLVGSWKKVNFDTIEAYSLDDIYPKCKTIIYTINNLILSIKNSAQLFFVDSLNRNDHSPETGLLYTFFQLFKEVQSVINDIPDKYILLYFEKILQFSRKKAVPDSTHVTVQCNTSNKKEVMLPEGTEFTADINGTVAQYLSDTTIFLKNAIVFFVYSLYCEKDPYIEPEKSLNYYSGIKTSDYSTCNQSGISFPIFVMQKIQKETTTQKSSPQIGFACASKIFFMSEGERSVTLTLSMNNELSDFWNDTFKKKVQHATGISGIDTPKSWKLELIKILRSLFTIELTTPNGWYNVEYYQPNSSVIDSTCMKNSLILEFTISASAPPIIAYDQSIHGSSFSTNLPVCRILFNENAEIYPYSFLKDLKLRSLYIDVSVKGASDCSLYNQYGPLDANVPFTPFGPIPVKGDSFIIGHREMADKTVDFIDLDIEWGNTPWQEYGFSEYYNGYSYPFNNNSFKAEISELRDGTWIVSSEYEKNDITLFETKENGTDSSNGIGKISDKKKISAIKLHNFREKPIPVSIDTFQYSSKSKNGFIRLTLIQPECGFGQSLYTNDIATSFLKKVHSKNGVSIPLPPYYPVVNSITLNYHATTVINFSRACTSTGPINLLDSFYHILPFGISNLYPLSGSSNISLIPLMDSAGSYHSLSGTIFIGITGNTISGTLSLFFKFSEDTFSSSIEKVHWFFLSNNTWLDINPRHILSDTTFGLTTTGIITLQIPETITSDNTIMPSGVYWLRASVESDAENFGQVCTIETNGVKLVRKDSSDNSIKINTSNPVISIKKLSKSVAGIENVTQQCVSTGGAGEETSSQYITRISERLRHKNRTMGIFDYEHSILENFPEIFKVKCFSNFVSYDPSRFYPGNILICIVPKLKTDGYVVCQCPKVSIHTLNVIKKHIQQQSSPFVTIDVINPVYETIQTRCSIEVENSNLKGDMINYINKHISDYISPWSMKGNQTCFGWSLKLSDLQQYINGIPSVKRITNFSILHKTSSGSKKYNLFDSAEVNDITVRQSIKPLVPWSICIPFKQHALEITYEPLSKRANITGISNMEIGSIFIVKGNNDHGNAEQSNT